MTRPDPALAIDASEWFVDEALREHVTTRHWRRLPARANVSARLALSLLQESDARATFFLPAALAFRDPELLVDLVDAGHEIALSVRSPWPIDQMPDDKRIAFIRAWEDERAELERIIGIGVHGFSSSWSVAPGDAWWHAPLEALGFDYDATPVRGADHIAVALQGDLAGSVAVGKRFSAWQLDRDQPKLMGLPVSIRSAHEDSLRAGATRLITMSLSADVTIAQSLKLSPRKPAAVPLAPQDVSLPRAQPIDDSLTATSGSSQVQPNVPRLAIIVPLKDEADGVPALYRELTAVRVALADVAACEFVLIDDGSTDQTWQLLENSARNNPGVRLVRHERNRGVAAAIRTGFFATDADFVASIDGDLSYDPMELRAMLRLMPDSDVVTSSPYHVDGGVRNVPAWRLFLSSVLSRAYQVLLRSPISTWTSCFRVYRRDFVVDLPLTNGGFLGTAELLVRVLRRGGRVREHPCVLEARLLGFSKMRVLDVVLDHMRLLVLVALRRIK